VLDNFYDRATKAIDKIIDDYVKLNSSYKVVKTQDYAKVAATATSVTLKVIRLIISGGTDIVAWGNLTKTIYDSSNALHKAIGDIPTIDQKTRASVEKSCKYYKDKYLKGRETTWDKFKKFFSDPLTDAKGNTETLSQRLIRAEKPCHDMAGAIEAGLRLQDTGEVSDIQAKKLNKLLVAVSTTMGKVTLAKKNLAGMVDIMGLLEADILKFKTKKKPKKDTPFEHIKQNMDKKVKELKKSADDRAVADWASAAGNLRNITKELAALVS
jgi:stage V sporulation protein SpoVS